MTTAESLVSQIDIKVDGNPLSPDEMSQVLEVTVDQNALLPDMFTIVMRDPNMELLDGSKLNLTKEVEIRGNNADSASFSLIKGEITALEPNFREGMIPDLVVRGYDKSHRLYRETKTTTHLNKKDSDLARDFAGGAGLSAQVDATSTVYDAIYQDNQTDLAFLMKRAWRIGYECFVDEGKLYFRKPPSSGTTQTIKWGEGLLEFYPVISLAEQVDEVQVKGWDIKAKDAIVGQAKSGTLYPSFSLGKGNSLASSFGAGKKIIVNQPVKDQAEANTLAQARLNEISGAFATAEGVAYRRPDIRAGQFVDLQNLGRKLSGKYAVTSVTHIYTAEGLVARFKVSGIRSGLLFEQMSHQSPLERWGGVVPAVVTNTDDPDDMARVKVKYPWMADDAESWWARVISAGAGPDRGFYLLPEVGDEVMVAFEHGDINQPYILGGVWNGKDKIPASPAGAAAGEKPLIRTWTSIAGHEITMYDNADKKVEIKTSGGHILVLDDTNKKFELKTSGGNEILCDDNSSTVEIKSSSGHKINMTTGSVTVESGANMTIKATGNIDMQASGMVNIKGATVNIN